MRDSLQKLAEWDKIDASRAKEEKEQREAVTRHFIVDCRLELGHCCGNDNSTSRVPLNFSFYGHRFIWEKIQFQRVHLPRHCWSGEHGAGMFCYTET